MGMYTHVRGWIKLSVVNFKKLDFDNIMIKAEGLSPRIEQCISSTCFNNGFNMENYVFIGGEIKNYDDDWEQYFQFLAKHLPIEDYSLEMKYEEDDNFEKVTLHLS